MTAASLVASAGRPLRLRLRADLVTRRQHYQGRRYWVVKDPVSLRYYRFEDEEWALLSWLDGHASLRQLRRRFESRFAPQRIDDSEIQRFLGTMFQRSLLVADAWGQGRELLRRREEDQRRKRWAWTGSLLSMRFRGIDPDRLLGGLERVFGWCFSLPAVFFAVALMIAALTLVAIEADTFVERMPRFQQFFGAENGIILALTLSATKVLHELGHGVACRRFGGRCHELGVMLLLLMPCLYCNVTDSWMIPDRRKRAAIAAAGMYVELTLAAICTFLWWFSEPGFLNSLCLNVMFVGSVTTVLFNANPLMKYDGYYILCDMVEIPNLRQKATAVLQRTFLSGALGIQQAPDPFLPQRHHYAFAGYAVAAAAYRWVVTVSILLFIYQWLESFGLRSLGNVVIAAGIYGAVVRPTWNFVRFLMVPGRWQQVKPVRAWTVLGATAALLALSIWAPWPHYVSVDAILRPADAATVFVDSPGRIAEVFVKPGERVKAGDPLLRLENESLLQELEAAHGSWLAAETQLEQARQQARVDEKAWDLVPGLVEAATMLKEHRGRIAKEVERLTIRAPRDGLLLAPEDRVPEQKPSDEVLPTFQGSPFAERNRGAWLESATVLGRVGEPDRWEAALAVPQEQLEFVGVGRRVDLLMPHQGSRAIESKVAHVASSRMEDVPEALDVKHGGRVATEVDSRGRARPLTATYEVVCRWSDDTGRFAIGETAHARIHAGERSLAQRLVRYLKSTFSFEL